MELCVSRKAGDARAELCEAVERQAIELLVVGSRGLGAISRWVAVLGSVLCPHVALISPVPQPLGMAVERQAIELLVVGSRGLGAVSRAMLGSVSDYLIHNASCPVLVVPNPFQQ
ncbi:unnamed protein product [Closterium sp. NIES-53]